MSFEGQRGYDPSKLLTWILGIIGAVIAAGVIASVGMLIRTGDRLTKIETTITENRMERQGQIQDLRDRIERLEIRVYREEAK